MNQHFKTICLLTIAGLALADTTWGAVQWVGGTSNDFGLPDNWSPVIDGSPNGQSLLINAFTGNYPVLADGGTYSVNDISVGNPSAGGPGRFAIVNGTIYLQNSLDVGDGSEFDMTGNGTIYKLGLGGDVFVGQSGATSANFVMSAISVFNQSYNNFYVGVYGAHGTLTLTNVAHLNIDSGSTGSLKVGDNGSTGELKMDQGTQINLTSGTNFNLGENGSIGTMTMTNSPQVNMNGGGSFTLGVSDGTGTLSMFEGSHVNIHDGGSLTIGANTTKFGKIIMTQAATINVDRGNAASSGNVYVGGTGGSGSLEMSGTDTPQLNVDGGGSVYVGYKVAEGSSAGSGTIVLNGNAKVNITGGGSLYCGYNTGIGSITVAADAKITCTGSISLGEIGSTASGTVITSGTIDHTNASGPIVIGNSGGTGTWTQSGGSTVDSYATYLGDFAPGQGTSGNQSTLNLNGGTYATPYIQAGYSLGGGAGATQTVNFNGGTLKALGSSSDFIAANGSTNFNLFVLANGGKIDTNYFDITISTPISTPIGIVGGGLEKLGPGVLTFTGPISYTGPTKIDEGALSIDNGLATTLGDISGAGDLYVAATKPNTVLNAASINVNSLVIGSTGYGAQAVPEPGAMSLLLLAGLAAVSAYARRK